MSGQIAFRQARPEDTGLILRFIRELAAYEHMEDQVVADEETLRRWIFEKKSAQVLFALADTACGSAAVSRGYKCVTLNATYNFLRGGLVGDIITAVNGNPASATSDILTVKNTLGVGDTITFTIWRDGETFDVDVTLVDENDLK